MNDELPEPYLEVVHQTKGSNLTGLGYDVARGILAVEFQGTRLYNYSDVPPNVYGDLLFADASDNDSAGKAFNRIIRGRYSEREIQRKG